MVNKVNELNSIVQEMMWAIFFVCLSLSLTAAQFGELNTSMRFTLAYFVYPCKGLA